MHENHEEKDVDKDRDKEVREELEWLHSCDAWNPAHVSMVTTESVDAV